MNRDDGIASAIMEIDGSIDEMAVVKISRLFGYVRMYDFKTFIEWKNDFFR